MNCPPQVGVVPVEGVVSIVDELQNPDGVWVRIGRDSLAELAPGHAEGWCLQYNQGLNSIDILNFGHVTGPCSGPNSVLGHRNFRHGSKLQT